MIKLYNDDCLNRMDKLIEEGIVVDAIITDPPLILTIPKYYDIIW